MKNPRPGAPSIENHFGRCVPIFFGVSSSVKQAGVAGTPTDIRVSSI